MPDLMVEEYRKYFQLETKDLLDKAMNSQNINANALTRNFNFGPVMPKGVDYNKLEEINELMTKLMKKYIDKV